MKKIAIFITVILIVLNCIAVVSAESAQKSVEVFLSNIPDTLKVGETVVLTATTVKHGSSFNDGWSNAVGSFTIFDTDTGTYISEASFIAEKPGIFVISYSIDMSAGKSNVVFSGKAEKTIEVINPVTVVGAGIRDLAIKPVYRADGSISSYSASCTVYTLWSDQTATPYSTRFFHFGSNETEKKINVTISYNGVQYNYIFTVRR